MYPSLDSGERERAAADTLRACSSAEGYSSNPPESVSPESVGMRACSEFPERIAHSVMPAGNALASLAAHDPLRASLLAAPRLPRPPATPRLHATSERAADGSVPAPVPGASELLTGEPARRSADVAVAVLALAIGFGGGLLLAWILGLV
jgi:hypothetical protein